MTAITKATAALQHSAADLSNCFDTILEGMGRPTLVDARPRVVAGAGKGEASALAFDGPGLRIVTYRAINQPSVSYPGDVARFVEQMAAWRGEEIVLARPDGMDGFIGKLGAKGVPSREYTPSTPGPIQLIHGHPGRIAGQRAVLTHALGEASAWTARSTSLVTTLRSAAIEGSLTDRAAARVASSISGSDRQRVMLEQLAQPNDDIGRAARYVASRPEGSQSFSGIDDIPREWTGVHDNGLLFRIRERGPATGDLAPYLDVQSRRPIDAGWSAVRRDTAALHAIASLGSVRAAEDGAGALVRDIRGMKAIGPAPDPVAGVATADQLAQALREVDAGVRSAQSSMRGLIDATMFTDGGKLAARPDAYAAGVGESLAHLTGARDAYSAAASVLRASDLDAAHASALDDAATAVNVVALKLGDIHDGAVLSLAGRGDDIATPVAAPWGDAPAFAKLHPDSSVKRSIMRDVKLEQSFATERTSDLALADELDAPLAQLDDHQIRPPGWNASAIQDEEFRALEELLRAGA